MDDSRRKDTQAHAQPRGRGDKVNPPARGDKGEKGRPRRREIPWCRLIQEKGRKYTPWVLLRFNDTDMGLRPIPANTPFWISPDIWVESSDPLGRPVAGEPNYLHARVFNLGKAPAYPTRVQYYWGNPSLGLGAATMNLIGTEWAYVPAHASMDVRCNTPWVPVIVNNGHECLMVNTSAPMLDPITQPFQARLDRHVGQRNVMVVPGSAGQFISLQLAANNLFPMMARTQFSARVNHLMVDEKAFRHLERGQVINELASFGHGRTNTPEELLARYTRGSAEARLAAKVAPAIAKIKPIETRLIRPVDRSARSATYISAKLSDKVTHFAAGDTLGVAGRLFDATDTLNPTEAPKEVALQAVDLESNEHRTLDVELRVPENGARGEFVVVHIVQRIETVPVGGYTIIVAIENR